MIERNTYENNTGETFAPSRLKIKGFSAQPKPDSQSAMKTPSSYTSKKRWTAGKKILLFLLLFFVGLWPIVYELFLLPNVIVPRQMNGLDPYGSNPIAGEKVIAYDENNCTFSSKYVPDEKRARTANDVGYILFFSVEEKSTSAISWRENSAGRVVSSGSTSAKVIPITLTLIDYKTGEIIATETLQPPSRSKSSVFTVSEETVVAWLDENLPQGK